MKKIKIAAECHSDDYIYEVKFDAEEWFKQASADEIGDLILCDWRGDYPADEVALHMQQHDPRISELLTYVQKVGEFKDMGFEVSVNEDDAIKWLKKHRPEIVKE